jgi:hypothetical protein
LSAERSTLNVERSAPRGAVFLSYASQDAAAAKRIAEALQDPTGSGRSSIGISKSVSVGGVNRAHLKRFGNPTVGDGGLTQPGRCERRSA